MEHGQDMRTVRTNGLEDRGVYVASWLSDDGYPVLVAFDSQHHKVGEQPVPPGSNSIAIADDLWAAIEARDPDDTWRRQNMKVV